jgi:hypothetical protein
MVSSINPVKYNAILTARVKLTGRQMYEKAPIRPPKSRPFPAHPAGPLPLCTTPARFHIAQPRFRTAQPRFRTAQAAAILLPYCRHPAKRPAAPSPFSP